MTPVLHRFTFGLFKVVYWPPDSPVINLFFLIYLFIDPPTPRPQTHLLSAGSGLVMMIFGGQLLAYKLFRTNFVYPAELQNF